MRKPLFNFAARWTSAPTQRAGDASAANGLLLEIYFKRIKPPTIPLLVRRGASEAMRGGQEWRRFQKRIFLRAPASLTTPTARCAVTPPHEEGNLRRQNTSHYQLTPKPSPLPSAELKNFRAPSDVCPAVP